MGLFEKGDAAVIQSTAPSFINAVHRLLRPLKLFDLDALHHGDGSVFRFRCSDKKRKRVSVGDMISPETRASN